MKDKEIERVVSDQEIAPRNNSLGPSAVDPQALIAQAIDKGTPIETMERLFSMRRELKAEYAKDAYFKALSLFQKNCPIIEKRKIVKNKESKGGGVRYRYAPLEEIILQVREVLEKYGFSYIVKTEQMDDRVTAICESHHEAGHSEITKFSVPIDSSAYMNAAQKVASALTFSKRYAFCNAFGIMTGDDDDDSGATGEPEQSIRDKGAKKTQDVPEENKALYSVIMQTIKQEVFTPKERARYKSSADTIIGDHKSLKNLCAAINRIANKRGQDQDLQKDAGADLLGEKV